MHALTWMYVLHRSPFGRLNEYLLVVRTRFTYDPWRSTAGVGGDCLNSKERRCHSSRDEDWSGRWGPDLSPRFWIWIVVEWQCRLCGYWVRRCEGLQGWAKLSYAFTPRIASRPSQTACSPLVDPERMHSIFQKVACSSLKPNARVLSKA